MQIGELAKRTALTVDAIRFYENADFCPTSSQHGSIRCLPMTIRNGFASSSRCRIGLSLAEIKELIDLRTRKVDACESVRQLLKVKLSDVRAKMQELRGWNLN